MTVASPYRGLISALVKENSAGTEPVTIGARGFDLWLCEVILDNYVPILSMVVDHVPNPTSTIGDGSLVEDGRLSGRRV